jgi:peroxiredoxin Q/BCP
MPELKPGDRAPSFAVTDHEGRAVSSDDLHGTRTLLYFFPKADTSG